MTREADTAQSHLFSPCVLLILVMKVMNLCTNEMAFVEFSYSKRHPIHWTCHKNMTIQLVNALAAFALPRLVIPRGLCFVWQVLKPNFQYLTF